MTSTITCKGTQPAISLRGGVVIPPGGVFKRKARVIQIMTNQEATPLITSEKRLAVKGTERDDSSILVPQRANSNTGAGCGRACDRYPFYNTG